jgi:hypothetical protein
MASLSQFDIDRLRQRAASGAGLPRIAFEGCSLPAALDLACALPEWERQGLSEPLDLVKRWAPNDHLIGEAVSALSGNRRRIGLNEAPSVEFSPLGTRDALDEEAFGFFDRFRRALDRHGKFGHLSRGIAMSMREMADNAIQHSGADDRHPAAGAMAYEVREGAATFAVVDIGRGVLQSLRTNPAWFGLSNDPDALDAAVRSAASRRQGQGAGTGFSALHRALADLSGRLRFASGGAVLKYEGTGAARVVAHASRLPLPGLQVSVSIEIDLRNMKRKTYSPNQVNM